jgi:hypothetical protein
MVGMIFCLGLEEELTLWVFRHVKYREVTPMISSGATLPSRHRSRAGYFEWVIDQVLYLLHKSQGVWQLGMALEGGFVFPTGMDVEEAQILGCAESMDGDATLL